MHVLEPRLQRSENGAEVTLSWRHCDARGSGRPNPDGATGDHLFVPMFGASRPIELRGGSSTDFQNDRKRKVLSHGNKKGKEGSLTF